MLLKTGISDIAVHESAQRVIQQAHGLLANRY
jgi:hypothetical protein